MSLNPSLKIRDLVDVPDIKTVIQLDDLKDEGLREMIVDTFVLTSEVQRNLQSVLTSLSGKEGRGIFLKGHFGSGKSHFLSMLSALLQYPSCWAPLVAQSPELRDFEDRIKQDRFLVADVSLVRHRGSEFLEDIILRAIREALGEALAGRMASAETRQDAFDVIRAIMAEKGFRGLVLLVDELSEFLRSKGDAHAFNEDIRFLQYLGEEAGGSPLWVVASLQEWIEETGEIHQDTFNKIKDRYRVRLNLGRAHIEELVSERLIRHREGADAEIERVYGDLASYFPTFPVPLDRFVRLYPVHPATSTLLDRLKPLFSEHRGVVDFIHYRLKGDPERHIPSMMDLPAHRLLTPDAVFDHFVDRIRERSETQVFVERVFDGYRDEIPGYFKDREQQEIALSLIKLLILLAVSPSKFRYTVRHMAEMFLFQVTPMETRVNYQFILDILERLEQESSYVRVERGDDPLDNHYFLDLKADTAAIVRKRIRHTASGIFPEDRRLFWKTAPLADSPHLPLAAWVEKGRQPVSINWQHTPRTGLLLLRQLDELTQEHVEGLARQWEQSEDDFFLLVGTCCDRDRQYRRLADNLLPFIRKRYRGMFLFWLPAAPQGDSNRLREFLSAILLLEGTGAEAKDRSKPEHAFLRAFVDNEKAGITEHFIRCYSEGTLLWDEQQIDLSRYGRLSQEKFLTEFAPPLLTRRFPRHSRIQPYMDPLFPGILKDMLMDFLSGGMLLVDDRSKFGLRDILDHILKPMGLVKKKGNLYELSVSPKQTELARSFFETMGDRESVPVEEMRQTFRKGEYGLLQPHFEILVLALLFSGHIVAYKVMNRKGPEEIRRSGLKGITSLSRGEILGEELVQAMNEHPLIAGKFKGVPMTLAVQEEAWSDVRARKPAAREDLETLNSKIRWAESFEAFRRMPWEPSRKSIEDVIAHWDEVRISLPSREGLARFIAAGRKDPFLDRKLKTVEDLRAFLRQAERALFVYQYVTDQRLQLPAKDAYVQRNGDMAEGVREARTGDAEEDLPERRDRILGFFHDAAATLSEEGLEHLFAGFQSFQEDYARLYTESHQKARGGSRFEAYDQLLRSRRYRLLQRLDQLEMVSVRHDRRSIDGDISSILALRCDRSPGNHLQGQPVCSCGYRIGEAVAFKPLREFEKEMDLGISETLEALKAPALQEKVLPYLEGLCLVGKKDEAAAVRQLLEASGEGEDLLDRLERLLTPQAIRNINEAFKGKVVVVERDLDRLYQGLIHRKYTLAQARKILKDWLRDDTLAADTFLHFVGGETREAAHPAREELRDILEREHGRLASLYRDMGHAVFVRCLMASHWAVPYALPPRAVAELLRAFGWEEAGPGEERFDELRAAAAAVHSERPELFGALVSELEEDPSFVKVLWSSLSPFPPEEVFQREAVFSAVLKEAFERLLSGKVDARLSPKHAEPPEALNDPQRELPRGKGEMLQVLELSRRVQQEAHSLRTPEGSGPEAFRRWESLFIRHVAAVPTLTENLYELLKRIGVTPPVFVRKEMAALHRKAHEIGEQFRTFYRDAAPAWERGEGPRPLLIEDIPSLISRKRDVPDHRAVRYLLMDGMRWDLWEHVKTRFFGKMPEHFRFVRDGALWSGQPSDTVSQMERFTREFVKSHGDPGREDLLWRVSGIDEKVHTEKGNLGLLFANVASYLDIELAYRLLKLPSGTLLVLFSDHGFVENPAFGPDRKYDSPRYIHGKDSPFEVIVPWAWVMRL